MYDHNSDSAIPKAQIKRQLERILQSELFRENAQRGRFLRFVVTSALDGKQIVDRDIVKEVYGRMEVEYPEGTDIVKQTKRQVRDLLKKYFLRHGLFDPIVIALPDQPKDEKGGSVKFAPGEAYKPIFERNALSLSDQLRRLGNYYLSQATPEALSEAWITFHKLDFFRPGNRDTPLGIAEGACISSFFCAAEKSPSDCLSDAVVALLGVGNGGILIRGRFEQLRDPNSEVHDDRVFARDERAQLIPDSAQWCLIRGAHEMCSIRFRDAEKSFRNALGFDLEAANSWWFLLFLFIIGQSHQAVILLKYQAEQAIDEPLTQAAYAFALYANRQYVLARGRVDDALKMDPNSWFARLVACLVCLADEDADQALSHYRHMQIVRGCGPCEFMPGLGVMIARLAQNITQEDCAQMVAMACDVVTEHNERKDWLQFAFIHIAGKDFDKAAWCLAEAWNDWDPVTLLVSILPIFDPLKDHPEFKRLVEFIAERTKVDFTIRVILP